MRVVQMHDQRAQRQLLLAAFGGMDLTDKQWAVLEPIFRPRRRPDGRGRPWTAPRAVLNGVLWVLRTGAPWHDLPRRYPPYQTCHRRFQRWQRSGRLEVLLQRLAEALRDRGKIDLSEAFVGLPTRWLARLRSAVRRSIGRAADFAIPDFVTAACDGRNGSAPA